MLQGVCRPFLQDGEVFDTTRQEQGSQNYEPWERSSQRSHFNRKVDNEKITQLLKLFLVGRMYHITNE